MSVYPEQRAAEASRVIRQAMDDLAYKESNVDGAKALGRCIAREIGDHAAGLRKPADVVSLPPRKARP